MPGRLFDQEPNPPARSLGPPLGPAHLRRLAGDHARYR